MGSRFRDIAAVLAALAVLGGLLVAAARAGEQTQAAPDAPNVVLITTDDQTYESVRVMKRVRAMFEQGGTTFERFYASFPLCCPARATWITGDYAHNHGVVDNQERNGGGYAALRQPLRVLPVWLSLGGYDTALVGKWLHDYHSLQPPPGWDRWWALVPPSVTHYFDYQVADSLGGKVHYGTQRGDYQTDVLTHGYAIPYIRSRAGDPDPFFLHLSYTAPHWGVGRNDKAGRRCQSAKPFSFGDARAKPAPRHARRFRHAPLPMPPSFDERNLSDKPAGVRSRDRIDEQEERTLNQRYRCELATLLAVDEGVGQIEAALRESGLDDETIVIYTSDNGYMHGEHRIRSEKVQPYEEAIRVPFAIAGPGVPSGLRITDPVANTDLVPTILDLARITPPPLFTRSLDGVSLLPMLSGSRAPGRVVLIEAKRPPHTTGRGGIVANSWIGVRTERYTYVEHYAADVASTEEGFGLPIGVGEPTDVELYDSLLDPYQLRSRHGAAAYAAPRQALAGLLAQLRDCEGPECVVEAFPPGPSAAPEPRLRTHGDGGRGHA